MILCLGEAIVDLVCERELDTPADADEFRPRFGGALANVAVQIARSEVGAELAGGVGDDPFGHWLAERLADEGVATEALSFVPGVRTPIAVVTFDREREPDFQVYDQGITDTVCSVADGLEAAIERAEALVFGSNTLVGDRERELTMRARRLALDRGLPVLFDPNLRAHRWDDLELAREHCLAAAEGIFCLRMNEAEAAWLAPGSGGAVDAAEALAGARGAAVVVVTRGADGAVARGAACAEAPGEPADVVSPLGAGDAFMGALAAGFAKRGWQPGAIAAALAEANRAGARACAEWRAVP
ncbi:MAG TPA: PfkB family carbohydrate kinase [Solirubrobacterales bacterium]